MDQEYHDFIEDFSEAFSILIDKVWADNSTIKNQSSKDSQSIKKLLKISIDHPTLKFSKNRKSGIFISFIIKGNNLEFSQLSSSEKIKISLSLDLAMDLFYVKRLVKKHGWESVINSCGLNSDKTNLEYFDLSIGELLKIKCSYRQSFSPDRYFNYNLS
jgi:hypothetical protein